MSPVVVGEAHGGVRMSHLSSWCFWKDFFEVGEDESLSEELSVRPDPLKLALGREFTDGVRGASL